MNKDDQMEDCLFCTLAKSDVRKIFEDGLCYVIPDKYPSEHGHILVISKEHHESILDAPDETVRHMFVTAKRFGQASVKKHKASAVVIATNAGKDAGQIIFHFHIHVIPKYSERVKGFMPHKELDDERAKSLINLLKS